MLDPLRNTIEKNGKFLTVQICIFFVALQKVNDRKKLKRQSSCIYIHPPPPSVFKCHPSSYVLFSVKMFHISHTVDKSFAKLSIVKSSLRIEEKNGDRGEGQYHRNFIIAPPPEITSQSDLKYHRSYENILGIIFFYLLFH